MDKTIIGVRDVDEETFRKFKALAVQKRINLGEALTNAMRKTMQEENNKPKKMKLPQVKPFSWGKGTEKTSEEVDKILYG